MKKVAPLRALLSFVLLAAFAAAASAQGLVDSRRALTTFPDSQAVLFINVKRIVGEAMPRVLPAAEYEKILAEPQKIGFDVRGVEYLIAGVRFADPQAPAGMPEFVLLLKGNFNADSMVALAKMGLATQNMMSRQETHGSRTLEIVNVEKFTGGGEPKEGEQKKPSPYPEIAATALDGNTLVIGVPANLRATIDAAAGGGQGGQLRASLVELATHDPQALWSISAEVPAALPEYVKKFGLPSNPQIEDMLGWFKQVSLSNGMDALNFSASAAVGLDSPEHANALSGIVKMGIAAVQTAAQNEIARKKAKPREAQQAQTALRALRTFTNRTEGNTLLLGISIPQKSVAEIVKKEFLKKPAPKTGTASRKGVRRRSPRR